MSDIAALYESLGETQKRGQATEAIVKAEFVIRDIPVLIPEYDNEPYDFVVEVDDEFLKIQAKTAYQHESSTVRFETVSTRVRSDGYEREGYAGEIDYFAVYNPLLEETYLIEIDEAATGKMEIRFKPTIDILLALKGEDSRALGYYGSQPTCSLGWNDPEV